MTWKQLETSREIRLWLGQIVIPIGAGIGLIMSNPKARAFVSQKASAAKHFVKSKLNFKKES